MANQLPLVEGRFAAIETQWPTMRADADMLWDEARKANDIHGMFKACRLAAGFSETDMAEAINTELIGNHTVSRTGPQKWEHDGLPGRETFSGTDPITVYSAIAVVRDERYRSQIDTDAPDWWNAERATTMLAAYKAAIDARRENGGRAVAQCFKYTERPTGQSSWTKG